MSAETDQQEAPKLIMFTTPGWGDSWVRDRFLRSDIQERLILGLPYTPPKPWQIDWTGEV